jgi:hypothetical protein
MVLCLGAQHSGCEQADLPIHSWVKELLCTGLMVDVVMISRGMITPLTNSVTSPTLAS